MMKKQVAIILLLLLLLSAVARSRAASPAVIEPQAYLPIVISPPAFTKTPVSPLYLQNYANNDGCNWLGAAGEVLDADRRPVPNNSYQVHIWGNGLDERAPVGGAPAYSPSGWEQQLAGSPVALTYTVQLETVTGTAVSPPYTIQTRATCNQNLTRFDFIQGDGL